MSSKSYHAPQSLAEAAILLRANEGCHILAGGTDLLVQMRGGAKQANCIVDIKAIPGMTDVSLDASGLTLGAAAPAQSVTERDDIKAIFPGIVEAIDLIGSTQVQGRCSVGGNLCNSSPAADTVPALIASSALCNISGPDGERQIPVEAFTTGPGQNCLEPGEILTSLFIPAPAARSADAYLRFIPRTEMDIAVVGAGVALTLDEDGTCIAARVAIGAVAPTALLVPEAAKALIGSNLDEAALEAASEAASAAANPISDKRGSADFRCTVVGVMTKRAAVIAKDRALRAGQES
ncbi:MAG: CO/xanthine dehydrogenase FAD-binding subunit [Halioglobus sp.]|jgi:carbon-monoxide dehydrogenase medium subunit